MTGFELLEILTKADNDILRNEVYAGESDGDRVVNAYLHGDNIILETQMQLEMEAYEQTYGG